ncbi:MAG: CoA pyrophosphatase [Bacteroidales bacterium]|nr:CoA pyrophosphatase [Bacteroidales bacterium]MDY0216237.1 CoA pyrophosphatase [Bacteroidales bacterium]
MNLKNEHNLLKTCLIHSKNENHNNKINSEKFRKIANNNSFSTHNRPFRLSSVALILYNKGQETHSLFIKRATYSGYHSNQYALPGGKKDKSDITTVQTAIRETYEELGILIKPKEIIGQLDPILIPISNYIVFPYVVFLDHAPIDKPDKTEVEECYHYPISELLSPDSEIQTEVILNNTPVEVYAYKIQNQIIWGATAIMLFDFKNRLKNIKAIF